MTTGPEPAAVPDELLRPVLEAAVALAQAGAKATPPLAVPPALRRFLRFTRLPSSALGPVRRAVEADAEFRARLAHLVDVDPLLGRAGALWLTRPEGWEAALAEEAARVAEADACEADEKAERDARRRLRGAEDAARRAEAEATRLRAELDAVRDELAVERARRREADDLVAGLQGRDEARTVELAAARAAGEEARRGADATRQALDELTAANVALAAELAAARAEADARAAQAASLRTERDEAIAAAGGRLDRAGLGDTVARAGRAAADLADALAQAGRLLSGPPGPEPEAPGPSATPGAGPAHPGRERMGRPVARSPVRLPGGVFDDSREAAEYVVRVDGVLVLVDGYNVAMSAWGDLPPSAQRMRLVDALTPLALRTGAAVHVVFDGTQGYTTVAASARRCPVQVTFSPSEVEADDVVIAAVAAEPAGRPVVVVTSDRRVRDAVRALGANVLSSAQFVDLLRR